MKSRIPYLVLWLNALVPTLYLLLHGSYLFDHSPLLAIIFVGYTVAAIALCFQDPAKLRDWIRSKPQWFIWLGVLVFWIGVLRLGVMLGQGAEDIFEVVPFYLWGLGIGLLVIWLRSESTPSNPPALSRRGLLMFAAFFSLLSLLRDGLIVWAFSYFYAHDSQSYLYNWSRFTDEATIETSRRSIPYPLLNALVGSTDDPWRILWLQILIAAVAVGALVYVIGKRNVLLAGLVGLFFALDANWGSSDRALLTESTYISFHVLALALMVEHYERHAELKWRWLLLAGIFYGWVVTIRPSGLLLAIPILLAYGWFTLSIRKTGWLVAGLVTFLLATSSFNAWRGSEFGISSQTGVFVAYPLFDYHLFSPENGEISRELDAALRSCYDDPRYEDFTTQNANTYIHTYYRRCLNQISETDSNSEYEARLYAGAYREAILKQPIQFIKRVITETARVTSYAVQNNLLEVGDDKRPSTPCAEVGGTQYGWCGELPTAFRVAPWDDVPSSISGYAKYPLQIQLLLLPSTFNTADYEIDPLDFHAYQHPYNDANNVAAMVALLMVAGFLFLVTQGMERFLVVACVVFIFYTASSVVAGHIFLPRYARPLSPFYIILSALVVVVVVRALRPHHIANPTPLPLPVHREGIKLTAIAVVVALFGVVIFLFAQSRQMDAYTSIALQAEQYFPALDSPMIYNPKPFNPAAWSAKWAKPTAFMDDELGEAAQDNIAAWNESLLPDPLREVGIEYLVFDQVWWGELTADQQAIIQNPQHYELIRQWEDDTMRQQIWLYKLVGDV